MAIPDFQTLMLPLLETLGDGKVWISRDLNQNLAKQFNLTDEEISQLLPSGQDRLFSNRVGWAKTYLKAAGLVDNPHRGQVSISSSGRKVLAEKPTRIDTAFLNQFDGYRQFKKSGGGEVTAIDLKSVEPKSPMELLEESFSTINEALNSELLTRLKTSSPAFFEYAVLELLRAMGYGLTGDAQLTGKPGDGGIDGIIREDKLGLDIVCAMVSARCGRNVTFQMRWLSSTKVNV
jgi:restriction system protein